MIGASKLMFALAAVLCVLSVNGQDCSCTNERPTEEHSCMKQAEWGKCSRDYMEGYCLATCGGCDCDCVDVVPDDGGAPCEERASWGACDKVWMLDGFYCAKTCGYCTGEKASTLGPYREGVTPEDSSTTAATTTTTPATTAVTTDEPATIAAADLTPIAAPVEVTPEPMLIEETPADPVVVEVTPSPTGIVTPPVRPAVNVVATTPVLLDEEDDEEVDEPEAEEILLAPVVAVTPTVPVPADPTAPGALVDPTAAATRATTTAALTATTPVVVPSPVPTPAPLAAPVVVEPSPVAVAPAQCKTVYEIMSTDPELETSFKLWGLVRDFESQGYNSEDVPFTIFVPTNEAWEEMAFQSFTTLEEIEANLPLVDRLVTFHELPEPTVTTEWRHGMNLRSELRDIYNKRIIVLVGMPNGLAGDVRLLAETQALIVERDIEACDAVLMKLGDVLIPSGARLPPLPETVPATVPDVAPVETPLVGLFDPLS